METDLFPTWTRADTMLGITDRYALGIHADSLGLVVASRSGLFFQPKGATKANYVPYPMGLIGKPAFYKGMAYDVRGSQIVGIPYAQTNPAVVELSINALNLPSNIIPGAEFWNGFVLPIISPGGQMLFQLNAYGNNYSMYSVSLDATGRPYRNAVGKPSVKRILFPDTTYTKPSIYERHFYNTSYFAVGGQLFTTLARFYSSAPQDVVGAELQRITPAGTLEVSLPRQSTHNLFAYNNAFYAVTYSTGLPQTMYRSIDQGRSWQRLYNTDKEFGDDAARFLVVGKHVLVNYTYRNQLLILDPDTGSTRELDMSSLPEERGRIIGLAEYGGKLYIATEYQGVYIRSLQSLGL
jgi:hypothetical protein